MVFFCMPLITLSQLAFRDLSLMSDSFQSCNNTRCVNTTVSLLFCLFPSMAAEQLGTLLLLLACPEPPPPPKKKKKKKENRPEILKIFLSNTSGKHSEVLWGRQFLLCVPATGYNRQLLKATFNSSS